MNKNQNPDCDGNKCVKAKSRVKLMPCGGSSNLIVCRACYGAEIAFRVERNGELSPDCQFDLPKWRDLRDYKN